MFLINQYVQYRVILNQYTKYIVLFALWKIRVLLTQYIKYIIFLKQYTLYMVFLTQYTRHIVLLTPLYEIQCITFPVYEVQCKFGHRQQFLPLFFDGSLCFMTTGNGQSDFHVPSVLSSWSSVRMHDSGHKERDIWYRGPSCVQIECYWNSKKSN